MTGDVDAEKYYRLLTRQSLANELQTCDSRHDYPSLDDLIHNRIADINAVIAEQMSFGRTRQSNDNAADDHIRDIPSLMRIINKYERQDDDSDDVSAGDGSAKRSVSIAVSRAVMTSMARALELSATALSIIREYRLISAIDSAEAAVSQLSADFSLLESKISLVVVAARAKHYPPDVVVAHAHIRDVIAQNIAACQSELAEMARTTALYSVMTKADRSEWIAMRTEYRQLQSVLIAKRWQITQL